MFKKFTVDGHEMWVEEDDFDVVREKFKENVQVDDLEGWEIKSKVRYNFIIYNN